MNVVAPLMDTQTSLLGDGEIDRDGKKFLKRKLV